MDSRLLPAKVILNRQAALPIRRRKRSAEILENGFSIVPGKWQGHDFWDRQCLFEWNAFGSGKRGPSRSKRIAGNNKVVSDGAALDMALRSPRTIGEHGSFFESILGGIAVHQHRCRSLAFGSEGFESTIAVRIGIPHQDDLALH